MSLNYGIKILPTQIQLSAMDEKPLLLEAMPYAKCVQITIGDETTTVDAVALAAALRAILPGAPILIAQPHTK
jgi:hypothetical protein